MKKRTSGWRVAALVAGMTAALTVAAAPVAAAGDSGSCVATFVQPQAQGSGQAEAPFGDTVKAFTVAFFPLGRTVSYQAQSPRDGCPFQPPA